MRSDQAVSRVHTHNIGLPRRKFFFERFTLMQAADYTDTSAEVSGLGATFGFCVQEERLLRFAFRKMDRTRPMLRWTVEGTVNGSYLEFDLRSVFYVHQIDLDNPFLISVTFLTSCKIISWVAPEGR